MLCIFELEHAERYQFFDQGISTNRRALVVWQRDRYAGATGKRWFKSRRLSRKKGQKETGGHWREWSVNERGKKMKRGTEKDKKRQKLKSSFIDAVSFHYQCIYAIFRGQ